MPKVPRFQERARLRGNNPTGFQSSAAARRTGDAIAKTGVGVTQIGSAIADYRAKLNSVEKSKAVKRAGELFEERAQELFDENKDNLKFDFKSYSKEAEKIALKLNAEMHKQYEGRHADEIDTAIKNEKNRFGEKASRVGLANFTKNIKNLMQDSMSNSVAAARSNPAEIQRTVDKFVDSHTESSVKLGVHQTTLDSEIKNGKKELVTASIEGLLDNADFKGAKKALSSGPFSRGLFNGKEQSKLWKMVRDRERQYKDEYWKMKARKDSQREDLMKQEQNANFVILTDKFDKAAESDDPAMMAQVKDEMFELAKRGKISGIHMGKLLTTYDKGSDLIDHNADARFARRMYNAKTIEDYKKIGEEIEIERDAGRMTSQKYSQVQKNLTTVQKRLIDKDFKLRLDHAIANLRSINGQGGLEALITGGVLKQQDDAIRALSKKYASEAELKMLAANGGDPEVAFIQVSNKYFGDKLEPVFQRKLPFPNNSLENLRKNKEWAYKQDWITNELQAKPFMQKMQQMELILKRRETIKQLKESIKAEREEAKAKEAKELEVSAPKLNSMFLNIDGIPNPDEVSPMIVDEEFNIPYVR